MKALGIILAIIGAIGTLMFGIQAMQDSESFKLFGMDIAVSTANWTPVIISVALLIIGVIMSRGKN
ncbi:hypothetical protein M3O96_12780 [Aquiflexum sp. TKW24L]|uniref:hypothetical protein n=1 Tax=Cyclobacteriaceae TaxID=563798 RepID=UPI001F140F06|nr:MULTISPECIES: hypothetical protein [Cyclobacteriaceae]MCH6234279.1 hypothetical protein [Cognataquiflexum rubidum]MCL6259971.1 hypothetical protein [Aquiflexum sp. TKW24L]